MELRREIEIALRESEEESYETRCELQESGVLISKSAYETGDRFVGVADVKNVG